MTIGSREGAKKKEGGQNHGSVLECGAVHRFCERPKAAGTAALHNAAATLELAWFVAAGWDSRPYISHKKDRAFLPGLLLFETSLDQKLAVRPTPTVRGRPGMCRIMPASRGLAGFE